MGALCGGETKAEKKEEAKRQVTQRKLEEFLEGTAPGDVLGKDGEVKETKLKGDGDGGDGDLRRINTREWLNDLSPDLLSLANEQSNLAKFRHLVPKENYVVNIENKIRYIKTLGNGATARVILATKRDADNKDNKDKNTKAKKKAHALDDLLDDKLVAHAKAMGNRKGGAKRDTFSFLNHTEDERFALKQIRKDVDDNMQSFEREATILSKLRHENIVHLITCYIDEYNYYISTRYCHGGALLDFIVKCRNFNEAQAAFYIKTILNAIDYCHDLNIVHSDLKLNNIVFDKTPILHQNGEVGFANDAKIKIIDFGEAMEVQDKKLYTETVGTLHYMPPEIARDRRGWELKKGDIWSIGIIAYILLCGKVPFKGKDRPDTLRLIGTQPLHWPPNSKLTCNISPQCKAFVDLLLMKIPRKRPFASEALKNTWIVDNKKIIMENERNMNKSNKAAKQQANTQLLDNIADFHHADIMQKILVNRVIEEMTKEDKQMLITGFNAIAQKGVITIDSIQKFLIGTRDNTGVRVTKRDARLRAIKLMDMMDPDHKGTISLKDYVRAQTLSNLQKRLGDNAEIKEKGIEILDPKHTGKIDAKTLVKNVGVSSSRRETVTFLKKIENKIDARGLIDVSTIMEDIESCKSPGNIAITKVDKDGNPTDPKALLNAAALEEEYDHLKDNINNRNKFEPDYLMSPSVSLGSRGDDDNDCKSPYSPLNGGNNLTHNKSNRSKQFGKLLTLNNLRFRSSASEEKEEKNGYKPSMTLDENVVAALDDLASITITSPLSPKC